MRDGYPEFSKMVSIYEPIREIAKKYLELERKMDPELLLRKMKKVYDLMEKEDKFEIPENSSILESFMKDMEPVFARSIIEKREIKEKAHKNVSYFVEMIDNYDRSNQKEAFKIIDEYENLNKKINEDRKRIEYYAEVRLIDDAYYKDFIDTLVNKIPKEKEFYTVNKSGLDHIAFMDDIKIDKMSRKSGESICSPKKNLEQDQMDGNADMGCVSCKKCIKSVIKMVIPKAVPKRKIKP